jgi:hypothetical protein
VAGIRVLLSEGSSLSSREVLTCLGPAGYHVEALDPDPLCLVRLSRWMGRIHRCPPSGVDPAGYLEVVGRVVAERRIAFSTAGRGVRSVSDERSRADAERDLLQPTAGPAMAQAPASGQYGQVQGLFDHGRLVAAHTSVQTGTGIGPSAAARLSVDHPIPRRDIAALGEALAWHGGLTLDYLHHGGTPSYIECNPRTVEPANAAASGVNIPDLQVRLTLGGRLCGPVRTGRAGVRTYGTIALLLGAAAYGGTRRAVVSELVRAIARRGCYRAGSEQLTPVLRDPPSAAALAFVTAQALASPRRATELAGRTVERYSITAKTIDVLSAAVGGQAPT